jgi:hypothetical protein
MIKKSKYGNRKVSRTVQGVVYKFDSMKEARHFDLLRARLKAGEISDLCLQPKFELIPKMKFGEETLRKITYAADFGYIEDGKQTIVDVKGMRTDVYKIKLRLFLQQYGDKYIFKEV